MSTITDMRAAGVIAVNGLRAVLVALAWSGAPVFAQPADPRPGFPADAGAMVPWLGEAPAAASSGRGICGNPNILGRLREPIVERRVGCFILNPIELRAVEGVQLSQPALVDCPTARALADWVATGVKPVFADRGGGVAVLQVAGSFACRPVNNQIGARLSEHGRGRAIDISGFRMADGQWVTVAKGWRDPELARDLRRIHAIACGPFATVLGPGADRFHQGHFHLDTALGSNGVLDCR